MDLLKLIIGVEASCLIGGAVLLSRKEKRKNEAKKYDAGFVVVEGGSGGAFLSARVTLFILMIVDRITIDNEL